MSCRDGVFGVLPFRPSSFAERTLRSVRPAVLTTFLMDCFTAAFAAALVAFEAVFAAVADAFLVAFFAVAEAFLVASFASRTPSLQPLWPCWRLEPVP